MPTKTMPWNVTLESHSFQVTVNAHKFSCYDNRKLNSIRIAYILYASALDFKTKCTKPKSKGTH